MTTQMKVDVKKSLGYQENGRLKPKKIEKANTPMKQFWCADCQKGFELSKTDFGTKAKCPECGNVMLQVVAND